MKKILKVKNLLAGNIPKFDENANCLKKCPLILLPIMSGKKSLYLLTQAIDVLRKFNFISKHINLDINHKITTQYKVNNK